jgi:hypothetical protein
MNKCSVLYLKPKDKTKRTLSVKNKNLSYLLIY